MLNESYIVELFTFIYYPSNMIVKKLNIFFYGLNVKLTLILYVVLNMNTS